MLTRRAFQISGASALASLLFRGPKARAATATPSASELSAATLLAFQTRLALDLVPLLLGSEAQHAVPGPRTNAIVSPMSLSLALAVLGPLSSQTMHRSLYDVLRMGRAAQDEKPLAAVLERSRSIGSASAEGPSPLSVANALMFDRQLKPNDQVRNAVKAAGVYLSEEDLASQSAVEHVNAWVKGATRDLIPSILDEPPGVGGLVALDALYFKDSWTSPFDPALTAKMPFLRLAGPPVSVDMMRFRGSFLARQDRGVTAVDLPFKTAGFSLAVVTGTDRPAGAAELAKQAESLLQGKTFEKAEGELALPKFVLSAASELLDPLKTMGLKNEALTGLAPKAPALSQVRQRVTLSVDEKGAEAAAATAAAASRSLQVNFLKVTFDKPFLFALRDAATGFIIVAGYVGDLPAAA